ncbi:NUDIX hydrolase [Brevundimonas sp. VNH65]|uniref:NUDIX hydrolase n=1 Tax=Brevundimonas sp. VNH65 TaxID=3400917 RepID=UPI003BFBBE27
MAVAGEATAGGVRIGLSAVVMTLRPRPAAAGHRGPRAAAVPELCVLTTDGGGTPALPFGPFDPVNDRTFELSLRRFVEAQTGFRPGFVEQLYTFGDAGRDAPRASPGPERLREVSVGYLALARDVSTSRLLSSAPGRAEARWTPVLDVFPWEDRRGGGMTPPDLAEGLMGWAGSDAARRDRAAALFALEEGARWNEERALERYELLYEAGLVQETGRDRGTSEAAGPGLALASDHRRILATGLGRLRGKVKYRPVLFELTAETFTLSELQGAAEAVSGLTLHKQNFRRGVERTGLVAATGRLSSATGGRPAELFRFTTADLRGGQAPGLALPAQR